MSSPAILDNYKTLVARIDTLCSGISAALGSQITCSAGCSSCCTSITIFPVEAAAMREALAALPEHLRTEIVSRLVQQKEAERCPLLQNHLCLLYHARPIICRTHGLPITYTMDNTRFSDCCPLNLTDASTVSGAHAVDVDKINTLLSAVNSIYLSHSEENSDQRKSIAEALLGS